MRFERVGFTRGPGCRELAAILADGTPVQADGDLKRSCLEHRIDLLVARKVTAFDLVPTVVPTGFDAEATTMVVGAVAGGPHSPDAAAVVARVAARLGVPGAIATVAREPAERLEAQALVDDLGSDHAALERWVVEVDGVARLAEELPEHALLVVGAPGGSWLQRQLFGAGHRLLVSASGGTLVVRSAPRRCFQAAQDPEGGVVGAAMQVADALRVTEGDVVPVADDGVLVGVATREALAAAPPSAPVGDVMGNPVSVEAAEELEAAREAASAVGGWPVAVVDGRGRLVGLVADPSAATV